MAIFNGLTPHVKKVGIWSGAILGVVAVLTVANTAGTWYVARAASQSLENNVRESERRILRALYEEGRIATVIDSVLIVRFAVLQRLVLSDVHTRREINDLVREAAATHDSLFRLLGVQRARKSSGP